MRNDPQSLQDLLQDLRDLNCPVMAAELAALYRSPDFLTLDTLSILQRIVSPQYEQTMTSRINARLKRAKLEGATASLDTCWTRMNGYIFLLELFRFSASSILYGMGRICALSVPPEVEKVISPKHCL